VTCRFGLCVFRMAGGHLAKLRLGGLALTYRSHLGLNEQLEVTVGVRE
jgi:hypothetical protein